MLQLSREWSLMLLISNGWNDGGKHERIQKTKLENVSWPAAEARTIISQKIRLQDEPETM